jgi:hypothetical protein
MLSASGWIVAAKPGPDVRGSPSLWYFGWPIRLQPAEILSQPLARREALGEIDAATPLMGRPYDLRHAAVSTWLNAGVPAAQVAEWAGHSVDVLLRVYAKCIAGQQDAAKQRIEDAMRDQPGDAIADDDGLGPDDLGTGR